MKFAIKSLTRSDLTFFEPQYRRQNAGNQKSINLNRSVFIDELFPELPDLLADGDGELEVRLRIAGPGSGYDDINIVRKITKGLKYKNYRLNGEFVKNPDDAAGRFDHLAVGDLAVLAFEGVEKPRLIRLFVLSSAETDDKALLSALHRTSTKSMYPISRKALAEAIAKAPPNHPIHDLFLEPELAADLDQAAQGDAQAVKRLLGRPGNRKVSSAQLEAARRRAQRIGFEGEQLVDAHLSRGDPDLIEHVWASAKNAISPFDFEVTLRGVGAVKVEVKATTNDHLTPFHISTAELETAAAVARYDIYRVSRLTKDGATLRIAEGIGDFSREVLSFVKGLPAGVRPDSFTVDPSRLTWSAHQDLGWPEEDDD